jgi:transcriptional regulator with XRE-family HTH domain
MSKPIPNHLRARRKRWRLSQREFAFLVGSHTRERVSKSERFLRQPTLEFVLACEAVFAEPSWQLFPGLYARIEADVVERAAKLHETISKQAGIRAEQKRHFLRALLQRSRPDNPHV